MSLELDPIYEEALLAPAWGPGMQELQVLAGPVGAAVDFVSSAGMAKKRELKAWKDGECAFFFLARLLLADFASTQRRSSTRFAFFETGGPHLLTGSEKCVFI